MLDTHCHLTDPRLGDQLDAVLQRASAAGVNRIITIGTHLEDDIAAAAVCEGRSNVRCAVGVHPNYTHTSELSDLSRLRGLVHNPVVVALGEMGLDYFHKDAPVEVQRAFFEPQLDLATETGLPVVIHSREATDDTLAILENFPKVRAVFHCFTGSPGEARRILNAGYLLGFTGAITFKKNDALREAVALTPMDRMIVETDAPYLTPEPMRKQKINEPALVMHVAEMVAKVKGLSLKEVDHLTTANADQFFRW